MDIAYLHNIGVVSVSPSEAQPAAERPPPPAAEESQSPPAERPTSAAAEESQSPPAERPTSAAAEEAQLPAAERSRSAAAEEAPQLEIGGVVGAAEADVRSGKTMHLDVVCMPSKEMALTNFVYVNKQDAAQLGRFVRLGRAGFCVIEHPKVARGTIALNKLQRQFLGAALDQLVVLSELEKPPKLRACCLEVCCLRGRFEANMSEVLWAAMEQLEGHVLVEDQPIALHFNKSVPLKLTVLCEESGATCCPAMLCSTTSVELKQAPGTTLWTFPSRLNDAQAAYLQATPVRLQLFAKELGQLQGEYRLFSRELFVNGFHFWRQWLGDGWLYSGRDGSWCLGSGFSARWSGSQDAVVEPSEADVLRSRGNVLGEHPHEVYWLIRRAGLWFEESKENVSFVVLQHQASVPARARTSATTASASSSTQRFGGGHQMFQPGPMQDFVRSMREQGMTNWVFHKGTAINLEDPEDVTELSAETLDRLIREACHPEQSRQPRPPVPLHPWEVDKLTSVASQVSSALHGGRYGKDFGEILLSQLGGWWGDEDWAQAESQRIASLVKVDDAESRAQLLRWVDESLVQSLREITKEAQRGQLAGVTPTEAHGSGSQLMSAAPNEARGSGGQGDRLEDLELQQALRASLEEDCAWPDSDSDSNDEIASEPAPLSCNHPCDMGSSCCACVVRAPRPGLVPGLVSWWQGRGLSPPPLGTGGRELRFLCTVCSEAGRVEGERWPLPFGGQMLLRSGARAEELVLPANTEGDAMDVNVTWEEGSWVAVDAVDEGAVASETSWVIP